MRVCRRLQCRLQAKGQIAGCSAGCKLRALRKVQLALTLTPTLALTWRKVQLALTLTPTLALTLRKVSFSSTSSALKTSKSSRLARVSASLSRSVSEVLLAKR